MAEDRTAPAAETEENLSDILRIRREKLAELRDLTPEEAGRITTENARRLYGI